MAELYLAETKDTRGHDQTVVVKTIRADLMDDEEQIKMLMQEAQIAANLRHPNIVRTFELGVDKETYFLAMEFIFGRNLSQIVDRCRLRSEKISYHHIAYILAETLNALHYAHHEAKMNDLPLHIIHRDVSPQNIMVGLDGQVKVLDFGLAKATFAISRTRSGVLKGKYGYLSPEQAQFTHVDHRADIFGAGVVLWELLDGRRLFLRNNDFDTVKAVIQTQIPPFQDTKLPLSLCKIALKALKHDREKRFKDAQQMRQKLLSFAISRDPLECKRSLAAWMQHIFREELEQRKNLIESHKGDPIKKQKVQRGGFEWNETNPTSSNLISLSSSLLSPFTSAGSDSIPSIVVTPDYSPLRIKKESISQISKYRFITSLLSEKRFIPMILVTSALGLLIGFLSAFIFTPKKNSFAQIFVESNVSNPKVQISGRECLGSGPFEVAPGHHQIVVRFKERTLSQELFIQEGEESHIHFSF